MKKYNHNRIAQVSLSLSASILLGLFLSGQVHAAETETPQTSITQSNQDQVKVISYSDHQEKPNNPGEKWSNPADYKDDIPVQFLGINDVHGNIDTTNRIYISGKLYQNTGNAARLAGYLDNAENDFKTKNPTGTTFRVEAGDMVGASPATSSLLQDEPTMKALKNMGITIGTLGNHEFDEGLPEFHRVLTGQAPKSGEFNKIDEEYPHENSGIEMVVSNLVNESDGTVPFNWKPYLIKTVGNKEKSAKVGFIGVVTKDLPALTFAKNLVGYKVLDEAESIAKYEKILRQQGVNAIVVLAHVGVSTYKEKTSGDAVDVLKKLYQIDPDNSVDLFIAAHSHQYANGQVGNIKIVQANKFSMAYDDSIGYIDPKTGDFVKDSLITHVYPVLSEKQENQLSQKYNQPSVTAKPSVQAVIKDAEKRTATITEGTIGRSEKAEDITTTTNKNNESAVGDLVVDAQLSEAHRLGIKADFAITNGGGVRSNLNVEKNGTIKWKSAQAVQPFNNQIKVYELTGQQLLNLLNSQYVKNSERYYLVSGMSYAYYSDTNNAKKVAVMYDANNNPLDLKKTYRIITSNYLVDSTPALKGAKEVADVGIDTNLFVSYIKNQTKAGKLITVPKLNRKFEVTQEDAKKLMDRAKELTVGTLTPKTLDSNVTTLPDPSVTKLISSTSKEDKQSTKQNNKAIVSQIATKTVATKHPNKELVQFSSKKITKNQQMLPQTGKATYVTLSLVGSLLSLISLASLTIFNFFKREETNK